MCKVLLNEELKGIELYFEGKPSQDIRGKMKENSFRWNGKKSCWYAKQTEKTLKLGNELSGAEEVLETKQGKNNTIDLFELTTFKPFEVEKNYNTKEITKEIRTHLKKRFSFIKMSVTNPYSDRIYLEIKESPFKKDSKYFKAIEKYIENYINAYKFCTSYDPYGDYGSSYNIYYFGVETYNMVETEPTPELIEAMKNFDIATEKAKEEKRIQEEKEYQEYLRQEEVKKS